MYDEAVLSLLAEIRDISDSDRYEAGPIKTVGGPTGGYEIRSPYNTECEWAVVGCLSGVPATGAQATEQSVVLLNLPSAARATFTQQFAVGGFLSLSMIFNVTAITGGAAPTVTFKVSAVGADGTLVQLEQAAALSAPGIINYSIGPGLDNKEFGNLIQVDMVLTGAPTSVTFSASIIGKQPAIPQVSSGLVFISSNDPSVLTFTSSPTLGLSSAGAESSNAMDGITIPISSFQDFFPFEVWQPMGRGANIYIGIQSPALAQTYVMIAFRRIAKKYIPTAPRPKPHTHVVQSRRNIRMQPGESEMEAGAHDRLPAPGQRYEHTEIQPQDTPNIGNIVRRIYRGSR